MNFVKKYLNSNHLIILFVTIISAILYFSIIGITSSLINRDNYSPELNPLVSFFRYLISPAWRSYRGLGFGGESESADLIRSGIYSFLSVVTDTRSFGTYYYLFSIILGGVFTGFIANYIVLKTNYSKYKTIAFYVSFVFYITSLWTVWLTYQSIAPFILLMFTFPLSIYGLINYFENKNNKSLLFLFICSLLFLGSAVISTQVLIAIPAIVFISLLISNWDSKLDLKTIIKGLSVFLSIQLIWIIPFTFYLFGSTSGLVDSQTNKSITSTVIDLERGTQTFTNSLNFYTRILTEKESEGYVFPLSQDYLTIEIYRVLSYLPVAFAIFAFFVALLKKNWRFIILGLVALIVVFLIKVDNPPLGNVFNWFQENIPLFKQVLRWPISKLGTVLLFLISILATFGVIYFVDLISNLSSEKYKKIIPYTIALILVILQFTFAKFLFNGNLIDSKSVHSLPTYYYDLGEFLSQNDKSGRIYYFPPSNNNYFRKYDWGFYGSQFISYVIPNPIIDSANAIGSEENERAITEFTNSVRDYDLVKFNHALEKYKVEYILFDESVLRGGFVFSTDIEKEKDMLSNFKSVYKSGKVTLYKVPEKAQEDQFNEVLCSSTNLNSYEKETPDNPEIIPINLTSRDIKHGDGFLVSTQKYQGKKLNLTMELKNSDIQKLPTLLKLENNRIFAYPSVPTIGKPVYNFNIPRKEFQISQNDLNIKIGDLILNREELEKGITVAQKYGDIKSLTAIKNIAKEIDLTSNFFNLSGTDCSGMFPKRIGTLEKESSALGIELSSENGEPCVYLPLNSFSQYFEISADWESTKSIPSMCLYSKTDDRCLNELKYVRRDSKTFGKVAIKPKYLNSNDELSIILSVLDSSNPKSAFRNIRIKEFVESRSINITKETIGDFSLNINIENNAQTEVYIPVITGKNSFIYTPNEKFSWYYKNSDNNSLRFDEGDVLESLKSSFDISNYLYTLSPNSENILFANADNLENIPLTLCLTSNIDNRCLYQRIFDSKINANFVDKISRNNQGERVNAIINSLSYTNTTKNRLNELIMFEIPDIWSSIKYTSEKESQMSNTEMNQIGSPNYSTFYTLDNANNSQLVSINQAADQWWLALGNENGLWKVISNDLKVTINGWEQGWDISESDYNKIFVLYLPNIFTYIAYALNIVIFISLSLLTLKELNPWKKKVKVQ